MDTNQQNDLIKAVIAEKPFGVVANCSHLSVLENPKDPTSIVTILQRGSEVLIDPAASTDLFYKICSAAGAEGYCLKEFITINH